MKSFLIPMLTLTLALGACAVSSPVIRHFQLNAAAPAIAPKANGPGIYLDAVSMPDFLLRSEMLVRSDEHTLNYDATQRWAEPLDLGIQRVLLEQLSGQFGSVQVAAFPGPPRPVTRWRLRVAVSRFEAQNNLAVLEAEGRWESFGNKPSEDSANEQHSVTISFSDRASLPGNTGSDLAAALSDLLVRFSQELADTAPIE